MEEIHCAICGPAPYTVKYKEKIIPGKLDCSARRVPDNTHFRMVVCNRCSLIYSSPIPSHNEIIEAYSEAKFSDDYQIRNYSKDYINQLRLVEPVLTAKNKLLEVGCGSGFFLKLAKSDGWSEVCGIEACKEAVGHAPSDIRNNIINNPFSPEYFDLESFDVICIFQVFDHLLDLNKFLSDVKKLLKPGGIILAVNHNIRSWITNVLGEKSPMYDMQHIYLFDLDTMRFLYDKHGMEVVKITNIWSWYAVEHVVKLFPFPGVV
ncbi:MAG: class I SAM-dependent methyltransferase [Dehalococcoidia bacterium]|nr:class I SAM-dependent methyltransferase [Dehalococcoidia bacterium]